ncbi:MFS transporter [Corynebacterium sp. 35RC1]|nr:MFS transporter [Corynebacterium sp. 35RC1]
MGNQSLAAVLRIPGFRPTMVAVPAAFAALSVLFPTVPLAVIQSSGSQALGGATTGVFMAATVATQLLTNKLIQRFGYRAVMVASALLLGLPALWYLVAMDPISVLVVAALRGAGFGALCVAQYALLGQIVAPSMLGKATGILGAAVGISQMIFLPLGLAIAERTNSYAGVFLTGAAVALLAGVLALWMPNVPAPEPPETPTGQITQDSTLRVMIAPALALSSLSMGFGAISSFLPAALAASGAAGAASEIAASSGVIFAVIGGAQILSRFAAGALADRLGRPGTTMLPALLIAASGVAVIVGVLGWAWDPRCLLLAAALFGAGFGLVQTESMLEMFLRVPRHRTGEASTVWNIAFDAGTGTGSFLLGFVAAQQGYTVAFSVAACLALVGVAAVCANQCTNMGKHENCRTA